MKTALAAAALALFLAWAASAAEPGSALDVDAMIAGMTLEEKVAQLQSAAPAIPRLGLPAYDWWSEGLHGVARNGHATVFPQAIGLAATWDTPLLGRVGEVVSTEARAKYNLRGQGDHGRYEGLTLWSPNINLYRDPRWGRGQETYGEDPYLTARLGVAFIRGLQGPDPSRPRVIATPKHFAVHSGPESGRHGFDVDVSPRDLEASYLPAFRAAITEGGAGSIMCAYNALHGTPACASGLLLDRTLRRDWGFTGFVVSDCDAVDDMTQFHFFRPDNAASAAEALKVGMDLNCGFAYGQLGRALERGLIDEAQITASLRRLLIARARLGILGQGKGPYADLGAAAIDTPAHRALALEAARKSIVLLKNDRRRLPLAPGVKIAVVGPNADALESLEANYHGAAVDPITPLQGLRRALGPSRVLYAQGSTIAEGVAVTVPETALRTRTSPQAQVGLTGAYYTATDFSTPPILTRTDRIVAFNWDRVAPVPGLDPKRYAVRWTGMITPPAAGQYSLSSTIARCFDCAGHDATRLYIDDKLVFEDLGEREHTEATLHFEDTRPRRIRFELVHIGEDQGVRLQWTPPAAALTAQALTAAREADVVVAFVGLSPDVEGEDLKVVVLGFDGGDRTDIDLPAPQRHLLEALSTTGKPLVIVLMSGGAVAVTQADTLAEAVLAAWYPGQAGGQAIAETLTGANNPSGRLPVTFYRSTKDLGAFIDYAPRGRTYRYFKGRALYAFGHGLSYTRFSYAGAGVSPPTLDAGQPLTFAVQVRNDGDRVGEEVAQLYLTPPAEAGGPLRSLVAFQRVRLEPGEQRAISFTVSPRDLSSVDALGGRAIEPGRYGLFAGGGQPGDAEGVAADFDIQGRQVLPR